MRNDIEFIIIRISNKMSSIHKPCKTHLHSKSVVHIDISLNEDMKTYIYGTVFLVIKIEIWEYKSQPIAKRIQQTTIHMVTSSGPLGLFNKCFF